MKGIKDFAGFYVIAFLLVLAAGFVFTWLHESFWPLMLVVALPLALLLYACYGMICRIEELEERLDKLTNAQKEHEA